MKCRVIALYLPQFHPTKENDEWWGKGFTEWTNVAKARSFYKGHYQPRIPADLGFYDLRLSESREAQAELAKKYGIEGFCYWHYWFGNGKRLLERPFDEVLQSGKPDFPFCLAWANHSWEKKLWNSDGKGNKILIKQEYPGIEDTIAHFNSVLPAFKDHRYIKVNGKVFFGIYAPLDHPSIKEFINTWQTLAKKNGLKGIYFVGFGKREDHDKILSLGFDAHQDSSLFEIIKSQNKIKVFLQKVRARLFNWPLVYQYREASRYWIHPIHKDVRTIPMIVPSWDHTPRSGKKGIVLHNSNPKDFENHVKEIIEEVKDKPEEERLILLKSWNEWGEGNYIEPDLKYGDQFLKILNSLIK